MTEPVNLYWVSFDPADCATDQAVLTDVPVPAWVIELGHRIVVNGAVAIVTETDESDDCEYVLLAEGPDGPVMVMAYHDQPVTLRCPDREVDGWGYRLTQHGVERRGGVPPQQWTLTYSTEED